MFSFKQFKFLFLLDQTVPLCLGHPRGFVLGFIFIDVLKTDKDSVGSSSPSLTYSKTTQVHKGVE